MDDRDIADIVSFFNNPSSMSLERLARVYHCVQSNHHPSGIMSTTEYVEWLASVCFGRKVTGSPMDLPLHFFDIASESNRNAVCQRACELLLRPIGGDRYDEYLVDPDRWLLCERERLAFETVDDVFFMESPDDRMRDFVRKCVKRYGKGLRSDLERTVIGEFKRRFCLCEAPSEVDLKISDMLSSVLALMGK